jgi:basic membrane protein A
MLGYERSVKMRVPILTFAVAIICLLGGCERHTNSQVTTKSDGVTPKVVAVLLAPSGKGDKSYNDTALAGLKAATTQGSISVREILPGRAEDYPGIVRGLAREGVALIIGVGFLYGDTFRDLGGQLPATKFLLLDANVRDLPNVRSVVFKPEEGSFLAGAAAVAMSDSGQIGFIGGMDIPIIRLFSCGYQSGARAAAARLGKKVTIREAYIGNTPDAFSNPGKGEELSTGMYASGIDVIYHAAGASGNGVIKSSAKSKKYAIGVDTDQSYLAPTTVITSMRKRLDTAVDIAIQDITKGSFSGGVVSMTVSNNGVDIVRPGLLHKDALGIVDELQERLVRGDIKACENM